MFKKSCFASTDTGYKVTAYLEWLQNGFPKLKFDT